MEDRELLELAAKSAGIGPVIRFDNLLGLVIGPVSRLRYWNPLTDDGDALRLAFTLRLTIEFLEGFKQVQAYRNCDAAVKAYHLFGIVGYGAGTAREPIPENVRRAIVRAAAEIGKAMA